MKFWNERVRGYVADYEFVLIKGCEKYERWLATSVPFMPRNRCSGVSGERLSTERPDYSEYTAMCQIQLIVDV